ncbi:hypothetical protein SAMN02927924_03809 [Sphingobium faniae]|nr:hypothetical protein SAMN02927924_03809 [Sphingobium faniae]
MSNVVSLVASAEAKAKMKKALTKGQTKAKTAKAPASQIKAVENAKKAAQKAKTQLGAPGHLARCRFLVANHWGAAALLYRLAGQWRDIQGKWKGNDGACLAMSRAELASAAGLGPREIETALKRLRTYASHIVQIKVEGIGKGKKMCVYFDPLAYAEEMEKCGYEIAVAAQNGQSVFG